MFLQIFRWLRDVKCARVCLLVVGNFEQNTSGSFSGSFYASRTGAHARLLANLLVCSSYKTIRQPFDCARIQISWAQVPCPLVEPDLLVDCSWNVRNFRPKYKLGITGNYWNQRVELESNHRRFFSSGVCETFCETLYPKSADSLRVLSPALR